MNPPGGTEVKMICDGCGEEIYQAHSRELVAGWFCDGCYSPPPPRDSTFVPSGNPHSPRETMAYVRHLENLRVAQDGRSTERIKDVLGRPRA